MLDKVKSLSRLLFFFMEEVSARARPCGSRTRATAHRADLTRHGRGVGMRREGATLGRRSSPTENPAATTCATSHASMPSTPLQGTREFEASTQPLSALLASFHRVLQCQTLHGCGKRSHRHQCNSLLPPSSRIGRFPASALIW